MEEMEFNVKEVLEFSLPEEKEAGET